MREWLEIPGVQAYGAVCSACVLALLVWHAYRDEDGRLLDFDVALDMWVRETARNVWDLLRRGHRPSDVTVTWPRATAVAARRLERIRRQREDRAIAALLHRKREGYTWAEELRARYEEQRAALRRLHGVGDSRVVSVAGRRRAER